MSWPKQWTQRHRVDLICCDCGFKEAPATVNSPSVMKFCDAPWFDYLIWDCFRCEATQLIFLTEAPEFVILAELSERSVLDYAITDQPDEQIRMLHGRRFKIGRPAAAEPDIDARVAAFGRALEPTVSVDHLLVLL